MCGIFGMISKRPKAFNKRAFCTMGVRNDSRGGDSCGVFIDGFTEYGVDKKKLFIDFFRESVVLNSTTECKVALGHCRKASVGKVSVETAQPVVLYNEQGSVDYVLIHNGTIYNYKELAQKYIPDVNIEGLTDSQVMARIFYYAGYDALDEYEGGAVFVIYDYRINKSLIFKGASKKSTYSPEATEERPLYYCWHNGRFVFSSIFETLYAFYYEETIYYFPTNKLITVKGNTLKLVKEYPRTKCTQTKTTTVVTKRGHVYDDDEWGIWHGWSHIKPRSGPGDFFKIEFDGERYTDPQKNPLHGTIFVSTWGYAYPNKKHKETWLQEVAFFNGRLLKHPKAFALINKMYQEANKTLTKEVITLINMLDFNPYSDDLLQYYWYDSKRLTVPTGTWKWPLVDFSCTFSNIGSLMDVGNESYNSWHTDYNMYDYNEEQILADLKKICEEE